MTDFSWLHELPFERVHEAYSKLWDKGNAVIRETCLNDRFFLLVWVLGRDDANRPWIYARCREVERDPDDHLDLWAREHYKSTVITFAGTIQEILRDPDITIGIFSHNRPTAKKFLNQIKYEFEENRYLKVLFPDIVWKFPKKDAPRWSEDKGIIVRRKSNPKEATLEAHGLVDGMPTGAHYRLRIYDDVVTEDSVTTPDMIEKTTGQWRLSDNLGTENGRKWHIGTRYHFNDSYRIMLDEDVLRPRVHPATDDGTPTGMPVLISAEHLAKKRKNQGPYIFACQQLLNPVADEAQGFKEEWLRYYEIQPAQEALNIYLLVDPANEKKKHSDFSAFFVIGMNADRNYYVLDIIRDRMNLTERADALFTLHKKWKPNGVGYEKYGKDSDIQHFEDRMKRENYRFYIQALGGKLKKEDRIRALIPLFEQSRVWLPEVLYRDDWTGKKHDLIKDFVEQEFKGFPVAVHDDMLDCLARIIDPEFPTAWPMGDEDAPAIQRRERYRPKPRRRSWMAA